MIAWAKAHPKASKINLILLSLFSLFLVHIGIFGEAMKFLLKAGCRLAAVRQPVRLLSMMSASSVSATPYTLYDVPVSNNGARVPLQREFSWHHCFELRMENKLFSGDFVVCRPLAVELRVRVKRAAVSRGAPSLFLQILVSLEST